MKVLVTGSAGFIGMHVSKKLTERGDEVIGIDNLNNYYDVNLKHSRLEHLKNEKNFTFKLLDISKKKDLDKFFLREKPEKVVHLAAQAGVRYSLTNPHAYTQANLEGFINILEGSQKNKVSHLVYASSSSVYGSNTTLPFSENQNIDHPISLYGATKKANELMAHTYSHLYNLPTTGLRFFTVYGPWGRPDMALFIFTKALIENKKIDVYNNGDMTRDFTYIDDIVEGVIRVLDKPSTSSSRFSSNDPKPHISSSPFRIFNIGNNQPIQLMEYIKILENILNKKAKLNFLPLQEGDVKATFADTSELEKWVKFKPSTNIEDGIKSFIEWYKSYYEISI